MNIPISKESSQGFEEKCVDILSEVSVNELLNQRLYELAEKDFSEIELKLRKSRTLKKDLKQLVDKDYYHQRENLKLFYRRLNKSRSIASEI